MLNRVITSTVRYLQIYLKPIILILFGMKVEEGEAMRSHCRQGDSPSETRGYIHSCNPVTKDIILGGRELTQHTIILLITAESKNSTP